MTKKLFTFVLLFCASISVMAQKASVTYDGTTINYNTLSDAITAASSSTGNPTVTLLASSEALTEKLTVRGTLTLDLNGYTISACRPNKVIVVDDNSTLTVKDSRTGGCIKQYSDYDNDDEYPTSAGFGVYVCSGSKLILQSGTIEVNTNRGDDAYPDYSEVKEYIYGVYVESNATFDLNGGTVKANCKANTYGVYSLGTVNMNGGTIDSYALARVYGCVTKGTMTVNDGKIIVNTKKDNTDYCDVGDMNACIHAKNGTLTVNNGNFQIAGRFNLYNIYAESNAYITVYQGNYKADALLYSNYNVYCASASHGTIYGGLFNNDSFIKDYIGSKYANTLATTDSRFKAGYCLEVSDTEADKTTVVLNLTKGTSFSSLPDAVKAAVKGDTLCLKRDYTLTQDLTIPSGVMLLIPCDSWNTRMKYDINGVWPCKMTPKPFHTLTLAEGKNLTLNGSMSLAARLLADEGGRSNGSGGVWGYYGAMNLMKDANLIVNDTLYCWGYIYGEGTVTMNKGSKLYEAYNNLDWRGGDRTTNVYKKMFPMEQYQVQNVESKLIVKPGATIKAASCMEIQYDIYKLLPITWVSNKDAFFTTGANTTLTRTYDSATDRMLYDFDNDVSLGNMRLDFGNVAVSSKAYRAHLMDNWTINIQKGTFTVPYKYNMLPGCKIIIAPEATMSIEKNGNLTLFDTDQWSVYCPAGYINPAYYTVANGANNRAVRCGTVTGQSLQSTHDKMTDATIDVQGKIIVSRSLSATESGANIICSNGQGIIEIDSVTTAKSDSVFMIPKLHHLSEGYDGYLTYPAPLVNADGTSVSTKNCTSGTIFTYTDGTWTRTAGGIRGDVNNDGVVNISDVNAIITVMCGGPANPRADVNNDGKVNISDVNAVISIMCGL